MQIKHKNSYWSITFYIRIAIKIFKSFNIDNYMLVFISIEPQVDVRLKSII